MMVSTVIQVQQDWDVHWFRIYEDALIDGIGEQWAGEIADQETEQEFGPRPEEERQGHGHAANED